MSSFCWSVVLNNGLLSGPFSFSRSGRLILNNNTPARNNTVPTSSLYSYLHNKNPIPTQSCLCPVLMTLRSSKAFALRSTKTKPCGSSTPSGEQLLIPMFFFLIAILLYYCLCNSMASCSWNYYYSFFLFIFPQ